MSRCGMPEAATLAAVADPVVDPGGFDLQGAAWFTDETEMLGQIRLEAVVIATRNGLHLLRGELCCARGIRFLMEKPVTATLEEAAALVRLGRLVAASVIWATRKPDDYFQTAWRTQPGGGPLLINAIHEIDMLRHLCGGGTSVGAISSHALRGFAVEDGVAALFRFDQGCLGPLTCSDAGFSPGPSIRAARKIPAFPIAARALTG
jgi:predicted dehydrogenase